MTIFIQLSQPLAPSLQDWLQQGTFIEVSKTESLLTRRNANKKFHKIGSKTFFPGIRIIKSTTLDVLQLLRFSCNILLKVYEENVFCLTAIKKEWYQYFKKVKRTENIAVLQFCQMFLLTFIHRTSACLMDERVRWS